ncbi:hypothetical protein IHQ56_06275 [Methylobacillus flagellatus]|uniref:hypothetical protein n=1 Tax=Methylobacillus flagellatus TaxID=405 RepID=UPI0028540B19|nr:hypothetical protein [Methylobacillus flagellatus]MDR5171419.1 hypothetical protein [Methylobacillus flagellatus]
MSSHDNSPERIAADILIAALNSEKISYRIANSPAEIAQAFKVIHQAVAEAQSSIFK